MRLNENWRRPIYGIVSNEFFETPLRYHSADCFYEKLGRAQLGSNWSISRVGFYVSCRNNEYSLNPDEQVVQISSDLKSASEVLRLVLGIVAKNNVLVEFLCDENSLALANSNVWSGYGAGSFIILYFPLDEQFLRETATTLASALSDIQGPRPIGSMKFGESKAVYRNRFPKTLIPLSKHQTFSLTPAGSGSSSGDRAALSHEGVPVCDDDPIERRIIGNHNFRILSAFALRNSGGVYLGIAKNGIPVVIKEAKSHWCSYRLLDAREMLLKEYRLIHSLKGTGLVPNPIDRFHEGDRLFTVYELVEGESLHQLQMRYSPLVEGETPIYFERFRDHYAGLFLSVVDALAEIQSHGIVMGDISPRDIVRRADGSISILSLESSYEPGRDDPTPFLLQWSQFEYTPSSIPLGFSRNLHTLGNLMLGYLLPVNSLVALESGFPQRFAQFISKRFNLGGPISELIQSCVNCKSIDTFSIEKASAALNRAKQIEPEVFTLREEGLDWIDPLVQSTISYLHSVADYCRDDCPFPSDPYIFENDGVSVGFGASGIALALSFLGRTVPAELTEWICNHLTQPGIHDFGLFYGKAGIAVALAKFNVIDRAVDILNTLKFEDISDTENGLFAGVAGWGISELFLHQRTKQGDHLERSIRIGDYLSRNRFRDSSGYYWRGPNGVVAHGLGHGAAGIALFFLNLFERTECRGYLDIACGAIDFELAHCLTMGSGSITWTENLDTPGRVMPYLEYGAAGIGTVIAQLWAITGDAKYRVALEKIASGCGGSLSPFPGFSIGLSGIGHFFLDLYSMLGNDEYRTRAVAMAKSVRAYAINRIEGTAFPGHGLTRISCDFASGSCSVATFVHRVAHGGNNPLLSGMLAQVKPSPTLKALCLD
jgi:serine/threonine protein kinase